MSASACVVALCWARTMSFAPSCLVDYAALWCLQYIDGRRQNILAQELGVSLVCFKKIDATLNVESTTVRTKQTAISLTLTTRT